jgi:hypothetical protein
MAIGEFKELNQERVDLAYKLAQQYINTLFEIDDVPQFLPESRAQIVSYKTASKRRVYTHAMNTLEKKRISARDFNVKMFVKNERMDLKDPMKPPRAIQGRTPRYNLELQRYLHQIERFLFHRGNSKRVTTKGLDQFKKAQLLKECWDSFSDPVCILADHSRFDSRQHTQWLLSEHQYYERFYDGDEYLRELLHAQINNFGHTRNGVIYSVVGTRASGDVNTSLGNSLSNIAILCYWLRHIPNKRLLVDGDDSVIFIERNDLSRVNALDIECLGFETKYSIVDEFEHVDFCQCKPVKASYGYVMVRSPERTISRATVCIEHQYTVPALFRRWLHTVGKCEQTCSYGIPVMSSFCKFLMRNADKEINIRDDAKMRAMQYKFSDVVTDQCRASFYLAFGITPVVQLGLEKYFNELPILDMCREVELPSRNTSSLSIVL